jgi:AcrR family transcriptional regulator
VSNKPSCVSLVIVDAEGTGLRDRTRRAVQAELIDVALQLFLAQGFETTTVDQIATAAGVSRRSFHRYFTNKEAVLALALRSTGEQIAADLAARPPTEAPWPALRRSFDSLVDNMTSDDRALPLTRMMLQSSAMQASHAEKQATWRDAMTMALSDRLPSTLETDRHLHAEALSAAAIACLVTAQTAWVNSDGEASLAQLLDTAMGAVAPI